MCRVHRPSIFSPLTVTRALGLLPVNLHRLKRKQEAGEGLVRVGDSGKKRQRGKNGANDSSGLLK